MTMSQRELSTEGKPEFQDKEESVQGAKKENRSQPTALVSSPMAALLPAPSFSLVPTLSPSSLGQV